MQDTKDVRIVIEANIVSSEQQAGAADTQCWSASVLALPGSEVDRLRHVLDTASANTD
jgi:hypothetical protein